MTDLHGQAAAAPQTRLEGGEDRIRSSSRTFGSTFKNAAGPLTSPGQGASSAGLRDPDKLGL
jgi:hypothetical protein